jgi:2-oxoisovalerate dehydrogenase E1 component
MTVKTRDKSKSVKASDGNGIAEDVAGITRTAFEADFSVQPVGPSDFEPDVLLGVYRTMLTSRRLDEKMLTLLKQGKGFFHIGCAGHESAHAAL